MAGGLITGPHHVFVPHPRHEIVAVAMTRSGTLADSKRHAVTRASLITALRNSREALAADADAGAASRKTMMENIAAAQAFGKAIPQTYCPIRVPPPPPPPPALEGSKHARDFKE